MPFWAFKWEFFSDVGNILHCTKRAKKKLRISQWRLLGSEHLRGVKAMSNKCSWYKIALKF